MPLDIPSSPRAHAAAVAAAPAFIPTAAHVASVAIIAHDPLIDAALRARVATADDLWLVDDPSLATVLIWDPPTPAKSAPAELPTLPAIIVEPGRVSAAPAVVALIDETDDPMPLLAAGVRGLLRRNVDAERLRTTVIAAGLGLTVLDEDPADALVAAWSPSSEPGLTPELDPLTPREREVLELLADGLSNRAIAEQLGISAHTVKFHVDALLDKLSARSRTQVVVKAVRQGLLELV